MRRGMGNWIGAGWVILFLLLFIQQPLPNNGGVKRVEILPQLPLELLGVLDAIDPPPEENGLPRGLGYLGERLPLWFVAGFIAVAGWAAGTIFLSIFPFRSLSVGERHYFAVLLGLGLISLGTLGLGLAALLNGLAFWTVHLAVIAVGIWRHLHRKQKACEAPEFPAWTWRDYRWWLLGMTPFLIGMALGSLSPSTDFDVNEYHLGGPKEWYLAGRIHFLAHDVYTSFPFLTEMLLLDGMVLLGDWYWGGVGGQAALMLFAPVTAWGIALLGRRFISPSAGLAGAFLYLSTPWVFRMSIIAYTEGAVAAYVLGTTFAGLLAWQTSVTQGTEKESVEQSRRLWLLAGFCAGGAMASKYTGLVMAVLPAGLALVACELRKHRSQGNHSFPARRLIQTTVIYALGVLLLIGPWLLKNLVETGNPVYPLGYRFFGGRDLDDSLAEKWKRGHARPDAGSIVGEIRDLGVKLFDVAAVNDWQSPLIFAFLPLAVLCTQRRSVSAILLAVTAWEFLCWWLFTHHLDRFWTPLLPVASTLAGIGFQSLQSHSTRLIGYIALGFGTFFNLGFVSTGLVGYNAGLTKLSAASDFATRVTGPEIAWLNMAIEDRHIPMHTKVLCVGEAELFHARFPYVYNTVFDNSIFEDWFGQSGVYSAAERPLRPQNEIRKTLHAQGITHLYVNWSEILRYRQPYSYGYSDFVHPKRFRELVELGVLSPPLMLPSGLGLQKIGEHESDNVILAKSWAPELIVPCGNDTCLVTAQIFPVRAQEK